MYLMKSLEIGQKRRKSNRKRSSKGVVIIWIGGFSVKTNKIRVWKISGTNRIFFFLTLRTCYTRYGQDVRVDRDNCMDGGGGRELRWREIVMFLRVKNKLQRVVERQLIVCRKSHRDVGSSGVEISKVGIVSRTLWYKHGMLEGWD